MSKNYTTIPTKGFKKELGRLSDVERALVFAKIAILEDNPFYSSLRTKKMKIKGKSVLYESSVNMDIRFFWKFKDNKIILLANIGHHDVLKKY